LLSGCGDAAPRKTATVKKRCVATIVGVNITGDGNPAEAKALLEKEFPKNGCTSRPVVVSPNASPQLKATDGKRVVAQSGCLACHRIGATGNAGPGPNLSYVGSELSRQQIARALVDPRAPMPSFRNLLPGNFDAVVAFLTTLRH
jgi:ubiquinol-cytochrome c reductase cytochrome b subunit/menaquinol-cytochrome c reductase cytochrome b/c subunit